MSTIEETIDNALHEPLQRAFTRLTEVLSQMQSIARIFDVPRRLVTPYDQHHPRPLAINGHPYRQRRRARRRRS